jgi:hypothetical protein
MLPNKQSKTKIVLTIFISLVLVGGVVAGVFLVAQNQELARKAAPATTLSISPSSQAKAPSQSITFTVKMDTGENKVTAADLDIRYNPAILNVISIQKSASLSDFSEPVKRIDNTTGTIAYSFFNSDKTKALSGNLDVITVTGEIKSTAVAGSYTFSFGSSTVIAGLNEGQNVLANKTDGIFTITGSTPTLTPTPTPKSNPTSTPTSYPSSTPTFTPTPNVTSTPNNTPTPTPTDNSDNRGGGNIIYTTSTPTPVPSIPVSGVSWPTILSLGVGIIRLVTSVALVI